MQGYDQHDRRIAASGVVWEGTGCSVDASGKVTAREQEGYFSVIAAASGITASAEIIVAREDVRLPPAPPPVPVAEQGLVWEGQVPAQKWMNFYTRVLARFATQSDLSLRVRFEVTEGVSQQKVDETRIALRELGLDEEGLKSAGSE